MLSALFASGAVAVLGLVFLVAEGLWLARHRRRRPDRGGGLLACLVAGGALLVALLAALRGWPVPVIGTALVVGLVAHIVDIRARLTRVRGPV